MEIKEFYEMIGGDYEDAMTRLLNDDFAKRMLASFHGDKSFEGLVRAVENGDVKEAFAMSHALKGLCGNLGLGRLTEAAVLITEYFRAGDLDSGREYMPVLQKAYDEVTEKLREL